jgi:hypothetical protein
MARQPDGAEILASAERLVLDVVRSAPDGLTNAEVGAATGLNPPIRGQRGYITWTILSHLVEQGILERAGRKYRVPS